MDIEEAQIDINCLDCGFINSVTLGDAINGSSFICVGCLKTIQLIDGDGETKRSVDEVNQAFNELVKAFRNGH